MTDQHDHDWFVFYRSPELRAYVADCNCGARAVAYNPDPTPAELTVLKARAPSHLGQAWENCLVTLNEPMQHRFMTLLEG